MKMCMRLDDGSEHVEIDSDRLWTRWIKQSFITADIVLQEDEECDDELVETWDNKSTGTWG